MQLQGLRLTRNAHAYAGAKHTRVPTALIDAKYHLITELSQCRKLQIYDDSLGIRIQPYGSSHPFKWRHRGGAVPCGIETREVPYRHLRSDRWQRRGVSLLHNHLPVLSNH